MRTSSNFFLAAICTLSILSLYNHSIFNEKSTHTMTTNEYTHQTYTNITSLDALANIFPKSITEIETLTAVAITLIHQEIALILKTHQSTFNTTIQPLDTAINRLKAFNAILLTLGYVHPDTPLREAALQASNSLQQCLIDIMNQDLYTIIKTYHDNDSENLSPAQQHLLKDYLTSCKQLGLHLPSTTLEQVKKIKKEIATLEQEFMITINNDNSYISATKEELAGVSEEFLHQLTKNGDTYVIPCKLSTATPIMTDCLLSETRQRMFLKRNNIAYPHNESLLIQILQKRHELALLLGYDNFASLDLDQTSAKTIATVEKFLLTLAEQCLKKQTDEFNELKNDLHPSITLHENGSLNLWDYTFAYHEYIKKHFAINESQIAEYFPAQKVIDGIFTIYQDFLGLTFKQVQPTWSWHKDVMLIEMYRTSSQELLGYLFLDLYPRENKYSHACVIPQIVSYNHDGSQTTSVTTLITNVPKPSKDKPALLKFDDVITFFHEFGHAMHSALSRTPHAGQSGINVDNDFAEVPSQMFEQWMFEPEMLNVISSHYKTGEPLPKEIIKNKIKLRKANSGYQTLRQCLISLFALRLMTNETLSYNPKELWKSLHTTYLSSFFKYEETTHWFTTFGHLAHDGYATKYYSYLWTQVFALDLFTTIKRHNFNPESSQKVIDLLSAGGSIKPDTLLKNFLGREPNQEAFLSALGLQ